MKAAGVTFAISAIERVIEERARGDFREAAAIRDKLEAAHRRRHPLGRPRHRRRGALEGCADRGWPVVAISRSRDRTRCRDLHQDGAARQRRLGRRDRRAIGLQLEQSGAGGRAGRATAGGDIRGATLGNDVNLRDFEGRSALLLSKAKDNNASCAIGPFIRLFDDGFTLDDVRSAVVELEMTGADGFRLQRPKPDERDQPRSRPSSSAQAMSEHHYPDGFVLFLGTLFAPTEDRDEPGRGFTHKLGDEVRISTPRTRRAGEQRYDVARRAAVDVRNARADAQPCVARPADGASSMEMSVTETLTHLINGEAVGGDAAGESRNPSNLDDVVARYPQAAAKPRSTTPSRPRAPPSRPGRMPRPRCAPTCSTRPAR